MSLTSAQYTKDRLEKIFATPERYLEVSISINKLGVQFEINREQASLLAERLRWRLEEQGMSLYDLIRKAPSTEPAPLSA